jgi:plastocyanin
MPPGPPTAYGSGQVNVSIIDNAFLPKHFNVTTGTTVIWIYPSNWSSLHTVTSVGNTTQGGSPLLNGGTLHPGQSYRYTFYNPGLYTYQCSYHFTLPAMSNAWINVTGSSINPPTSIPPDYTLEIIIGGIVAALIVVAVVFFVWKKRSTALARAEKRA